MWLLGRASGRVVMTKAHNPCNTEPRRSPFRQRAVPAMMKSTPSPFARLLPILRGLLGVGLLTLLVRWVGWEQLRPLLVAPRWEMVALSLGFSALLIGISCAKWQLLLAHLDTAVGLGRLISLYLIGILFNQILPSNVGGDVVRGYGLGRLTSAVPRAFATVFLERFTGFVALVACAWVGALIEPSWLGEPLLLGALVVTTATLGGSPPGSARPPPATAIPAHYSRPPRRGGRFVCRLACPARRRKAPRARNGPLLRFLRPHGR